MNKIIFKSYFYYIKYIFDMSIWISLEREKRVLWFYQKIFTVIIIENKIFYGLKK